MEDLLEALTSGPTEDVSPSLPPSAHPTVFL